MAVANALVAVSSPLDGSFGAQPTKPKITSSNPTQHAILPSRVILDSAAEAPLASNRRRRSPVGQRDGPHENVGPPGAATRQQWNGESRDREEPRDSPDAKSHRPTLSVVIRLGPSTLYPASRVAQGRVPGDAAMNPGEGGPTGVRPPSSRVRAPSGSGRMRMAGVPVGPGQA